MRLIAGLLLLAASLWSAPQRIISTGPSITEILFALDLGPRVVGVTKYCTYPPEATRIRQIGTWMTYDMEAILQTRPDLVIVQKTGIHDDAKFKAMSLNTLMVQLDSIENIARAIRSIGAATGTDAKAAALVASIDRELAAVRKRVTGRTPTRVMFVVGRTPGALEGIIAVGKRSYLSEVMEIAGGQNILEDSAVGYPKVGLEEILARNPEIIIDMGEHPDGSPITEQQKQREVAMWSKYSTLSAVKTRRIHIVSADLFVHAGPRVVELARLLASMFHPESRN